MNREFIQVIGLVKAATKAGISFGMICELINWDALELIAADLNLKWLTILAKIAKTLCKLAPEQQAAIMEVVGDLPGDIFT